MTQYDPPYTLQQIRDNYPEDVYRELAADPAHNWRAQTGIELIHREPTYDELLRIWNNWNLMPDELKEISDKKSIELFGVDNETHFYQLQELYDDNDSIDEDVESWREIQKMFY